MLTSTPFQPPTHQTGRGTWPKRKTESSGATRPDCAVLALLLALGLLWSCSKPNPDYFGHQDSEPRFPHPDAQTTLDSDLDSDLDLDTDPTPDPNQVLTGFQVVAPDQVREDAPFDLHITPLTQSGAPFRGHFSGTLYLSSDWGDVAPLHLSVQNMGAAGITTRVTLNREGTAAITISDILSRKGISNGIQVFHGRWISTSNHPVFSPKEDQSTWDSGHVRHPFVLADGQVLRLYYTGANRTQTRFSIGAARSEDGGLSWTRSLESPALRIQEGQGTSWGSTHAHPSVIQDQRGTFWMWFTSTPRNGLGAIAYAQSNNGNRFTSNFAAVLDAQDMNIGEVALPVLAPTVIRHSSQYQMWFQSEAPEVGSALFKAQSQSENSWRCTHCELPVLTPTPNSWDSQGIGTPYVIKTGTVYRLWYSTPSSSSIWESPNPEWAPFSIGYATSTNGVDWQKSESNPVVVPSDDPDQWDGVAVADPMVVLQDGELVLYLAGYDGKQWQIGRAIRAQDP